MSENLDIQQKAIEGFLDSLHSTVNTYHAISAVSDMEQVAPLMQYVYNAIDITNINYIKQNFQEASVNGKCYYTVPIPNPQDWLEFDNNRGPLRAASKMLTDELQFIMSTDRVSATINKKYITLCFN